MAIFDQISDLYDSWYDTKLGAFVDKVETDLVLESFKFVPGMHVLDSGCGTGNFSLKLAKLGCRVTGIDISQGMLEKAKEKAKQVMQRKPGVSISFEAMDVYSIRFPDNYFDAVFSVAQLEFLEDREKALNELLRVVKPGGQVIAGTINRDSAWGRLYMTEEIRNNSIFKYARLMTMDELSSIRKQNQVKIGMSLFVPPDALEHEICMEKEKELSAAGAGGFICAVWVK